MAFLETPHREFTSRFMRPIAFLRVFIVRHGVQFRHAVFLRNDMAQFGSFDRLFYSTDSKKIILKSFCKVQTFSSTLT